MDFHFALDNLYYEVAMKFTVKILSAFHLLFESDFHSDCIICFKLPNLT